MKRLALVAALAACHHAKPATLFGMQAPAGCRGASAELETCKRWMLDAVTAGIKLPPYENAAVTAYVTRVGMALVRASGDRREWSFRVVDDGTVQAQAGTGTTIFVNRGILAVLRDEGELAGVLGHELGHALVGHAAEAVAALGTDMPATWSTVDERDDELQADELAIVLAARAGYDAQATVTMMRALAAEAGTPEEGDVHPAWPERIARAELLAVRYPGGARRAAAYARGMATLAVGQDPTGGALVGRAIVFAGADLAVDVLAVGETPTETEAHARDVTVVLGEHQAVDVRVLPADLVKFMPAKPEIEGAEVESALATHTVGSLGVVVVVAGADAERRAQAIADSTRVPTAEERASLHPKRFDTAMARRLWSP